MSMLPIIFLDYTHIVAGYIDAVSYFKNCGLYHCLIHYCWNVRSSNQQPSCHIWKSVFQILLQDSQYSINSAGPKKIEEELPVTDFTTIMKLIDKTIFFSEMTVSGLKTTGKMHGYSEKKQLHRKDAAISWLVCSSLWLWDCNERSWGSSGPKFFLVKNQDCF